MELLIDSHIVRGSSLAGPLALVPSRAFGGLGAGTCEDNPEDNEEDKSLKILIHTPSGKAFRGDFG